MDLPSVIIIFNLSVRRFDRFLSRGGYLWTMKTGFPRSVREIHTVDIMIITISAAAAVYYYVDTYN